MLKRWVTNHFEGDVIAEFNSEADMRRGRVAKTFVALNFMDFTFRTISIWWIMDNVVEILPLHNKEGSDLLFIFGL